MRFLRLLAFVAVIAQGYGLMAQSGKANTTKRTVKKYPESFTISKQDFDNLFNQKLNSALRLPGNKYLDKSVLQMNSLNGDIKFLKLKLDYFAKSYMLVQVNGIYSTQIFIMSEDKSVFYKGTIEKEQVLMSKCAEDEIVTE